MTTHHAEPWSPDVRRDVETLWRFHRVDDELRPVDVAVGLGSHDGGVAVYAAELYRRGLFPLIVFTGANAPTTVERFPRGEAVHFREIAQEYGVPASAIRVETRATNTVENINYTRDLLAAEGVSPQSVLLISRPYQQRRAQAIAAKLWPDVEILCSGAQHDLDTYVAIIGEPDRVANMLVGDTQRLELQGKSGEIDPQDIPGEVRAAYERLIAAGYTSRLIPASQTR
ncbi:YdcF family protein [Prauserella oleivorans]|uniref:YdcF family protein n=1 Tax=Prauserella oleivorans TaxID=1478153 RepID=A0ABW5WDQ8_9PSEU